MQRRKRGAGGGEREGEAEWEQRGQEGEAGQNQCT